MDNELDNEVRSSKPLVIKLIVEDEVSTKLNRA